LVFLAAINALLTFLARRSFITLIMEAIRSSGTSVLTLNTRRNIPEDGILRRLSSNSTFRESDLYNDPREIYRAVEERRLLGYKNPVRTSQETHYVSAT
jgi:hypothetical protein